MNFGNESKKDFTTNHRANYATYNKSSIFEPANNSHANEEKRTLMRTKTLSCFIPQMVEQTPFNRRIKEFYSNEQYVKEYGTCDSSRGYMNREINSAKKVETSRTELLNAKERRFQDLNPTHKIGENAGLTKTTSFFEKSSFKNDGDQSAKDRRCGDMNSNIFNDPVNLI